MHNDFLHQFRFAVSFNDGEPLGFGRVEIAPNRELFGPGMVATRAALTPLLAKTLSQTKVSTMSVSAYTIRENVREDAPALVFVLHGVRPKSCRSDHIIFDATADGILEITPAFDYRRLELVKGDRSVFQPRPRVWKGPPVIM